MNLRYNNVTLHFDVTSSEPNAPILWGVKDFNRVSMFFYNMSVPDYSFERSRMVSGGSFFLKAVSGGS